MAGQPRAHASHLAARSGAGHRRNVLDYLTMPKIVKCISLLALLAVCATVWSQQPAAKSDANKPSPLAKNAPKDDPKDVRGEEGMAKFEAAIAPYVAQARATLPEAKKRYQKGLKKGEVLFVTVRIFNTAKRYEQVFLEVKSWKDKTISGLLASNPELVTEHKRGESMAFNEKEIYDWTISKPDGTEDGNFVGKFLDTYRPR